MVSRFTKNEPSVFHKALVWIMVLSLGGICSVPIVLYEIYKKKTWAVSINGYTIPEKQVAQEIREKELWLARLRAEYGHSFVASLGYSADPAALALEEVIRDSLYAQLGHKMGTVMTASFVTFCLKNQSFLYSYVTSLVPTELIDKNSKTIDTIRLKTYLSYVGSTPQEFEKKIETLLYKKCATDIVAGGTYVPEVEQEGLRVAQTYDKKFDVLVFHEKDFVDKEKKKSNVLEEAERYFSDKKQIYAYPEKRASKLWLFSPENYGITLKDSDITDYYEKHKQEKFVDQPPRVMVTRATFPFQDDQERTEMKARAENFRTGFVESPVEEDGYGVIDTVTVSRSSLKNEILEKAALRLKNDGDVTPLIETADAFILMKRVKRYPQTYRSQESVADSITKNLIERKFKNTFVADTQKIAPDHELIDESALEKFVKKHGGVLEAMPLMSFSDIKDEHSASTLFSLKDVQNIAGYVRSNEGIIIQLTQKEESIIPAFKEVESRVVNDIYEERAKDSLKKELAHARNLFYTMTLSEAQEQLDPQDAFQTPFIEPGSSDVKLPYKELPVKEIMTMTKKGAIRVVVRDGYYFLVKLADCKPGENKEMPPQALLNLSNERSSTALASLIASLYRNAKIDVQTKLISREKELPYER